VGLFSGFSSSSTDLEVFFPVHRLKLPFHDANGLVQPVRVAAHPLNLNRRKPLAGILCRFAQRFEMSGPDQERQVIIGLAENTATLALGRNAPKPSAIPNGSRRRHWDTTAKPCIAPARNGR